MKFFAVFAAVLALAAGSYQPVATWTLQEIEAALQDPSTDPAVVPYLINGLNTIVANLFDGHSQASVVLSIPYEQTMTLDELSAAIQDPATIPALVPYYEAALNELMVAIFNEEDKNSIVVSLPAMNVNYWSLEQLSEAIQNPETDPELMIYLEHALNQMMLELFAGHQVAAIAVVTPPGVIVDVPKPVEPEVIPTPVAPEVIKPPTPSPVKPEPVIPTPTPVVETPASPASAPLVQIIVNVNAEQQQAPGVSPGGVVDYIVAPTPVQVVDSVDTTPVVDRPTPVIDRPTPVVEDVEVSPVIVVDQPESVSPVIVVDQPESVSPVIVEPIHVAEPVLPAPVNPIDVIAVAAPDVNPVDLISPVPVVEGGANTGILV